MQNLKSLVCTKSNCFFGKPHFWLFNEKERFQTQCCLYSYCTWTQFVFLNPVYLFKLLCNEAKKPQKKTPFFYRLLEDNRLPQLRDIQRHVRKLIHKLITQDSSLAYCMFCIYEVHKRPLIIFWFYRPLNYSDWGPVAVTNAKVHPNFLFSLAYLVTLVITSDWRICR